MNERAFGETFTEIAKNIASGGKKFFESLNPSLDERRMSLQKKVFNDLLDNSIDSTDTIYHRMMKEAGKEDTTTIASRLENLVQTDANGVMSSPINARQIAAQDMVSDFYGNVITKSNGEWDEALLKQHHVTPFEYFSGPMSEETLRNRLIVGGVGAVGTGMITSNLINRRNNNRPY
jgi:hypothetical protein